MRLELSGGQAAGVKVRDTLPVWGAGCRLWGVGCMALISGFGFEGLGFGFCGGHGRGWGVECMIQRSGLVCFLYGQFLYGNTYNSQIRFIAMQYTERFGK